MHVLVLMKIVNQCLKNIKKLNPDVMLMDLGMPGMGGIEGIKKVKAILPNLQF